MLSMFKHTIVTGCVDLLIADINKNVYKLYDLFAEVVLIHVGERVCSGDNGVPLVLN